MNLADKLRFLADRAEDGKEFYMGNVKYSLNSGKLIRKYLENESLLKINDLGITNLKLAPQWTFTDDEKVILRNLPEEYKWIARDKDGSLGIYFEKPLKGKDMWVLPIGYYLFNGYRHLFQSIQWSDGEPCEFREYL